MEVRKEEGFWKWVNENVWRIFEEINEDSTASNLGKQGRSTSPLIPYRTKQNLEP